MTATAKTDWATTRRFKDVFEEDMRRSIYEFLLLPGWETGWKSNSKRDAYSFLHKHFAGWRRKGDKGAVEVYDCEKELEIAAPVPYAAWLNIKERLFPGHKLVRCYANGMAYGMDGTVHSDAHHPGNYTAVYYPHERWSPNWGGETIFYTKEEDRVIDCNFPRPNSMVVFDGRMPHRANGVSRSYTGVRITLMFKTEKPDGDL
jgi:SM-20-related protein